MDLLLPKTKQTITSKVQISKFTDSRKVKEKGFTLLEMIVVVLIMGILLSIAFPSYLNKVNRARQKETVSTISQIQTTIASYADEFGALPTGWSELSDSSAVMTDDGPATKDTFTEITLAGGFYNVSIDNTDNLFTITATRDDKPNLNVVACVNLTNGASAINQGPIIESSKLSPASIPNCG